ncbi:hypothetical protein G6O69_07000 [Pseudenhygromyxa sp. WMMC2535]|uniref:hypothetical protein n=1 Tax=Pseudenhygromyxa sp. WMMC2535 TaxID=2712867 RepID=UPI00155593B6|nr:hypothetical protein [Pseudenhygromyxa sp. WMMC2535]NVB37574.1 hypothetical protein [Pseudenhygromyxa sp. WMMC2535]
MRADPPLPSLRRPTTLACALACASPACTSDEAPSAAEPPTLIQAELTAGYPEVDDCPSPAPAPTQLVVTSTDFNTGAVGLIDLDSLEVRADLAMASSDAVPVVERGRVFVINRYGFDWLDELDSSDALALLEQVAITPASATSASANAYDLALSPDGASAWVSLFGAGELQRLRFPTLDAARARFDLAVDLRAFADADEIPELGEIVACGALVFVGANRIDRSTWAPTGDAALIPLKVDGEIPTLFDFDPDHPGGDEITLLNAGIGPWVPAPPELGGPGVILMLGSGLERIDLRQGTSEWLMDPAAFAAYDLGRLQLADLGVDALGRPWISAASEDFASFTLWRVSLDDHALIPTFEDLHSVTGALEVTGPRAFFADTTIGHSGVRVFDLNEDSVTELPESPLPVGLPPMSMALL